MEAKYTISEKAYVAAVRLGSKATMGKRMFVLGIVILCGVGLCTNSEGFWFSLSIGGIGGVIIALGLQKLIFPFHVRRNFRKYKIIQDEMSVELVDEGVKFSTPDSSGLTRWDKILKWRQNKAFVLIYLMPRFFHVVPKSVVDQGFNLDQLLQDLEENVGPSEFAKKGKR